VFKSIKESVDHNIKNSKKTHISSFYYTCPKNQIEIYLKI